MSPVQPPRAIMAALSSYEAVKAQVCLQPHRATMASRSEAVRSAGFGRPTSFLMKGAISLQSAVYKRIWSGVKITERTFSTPPKPYSAAFGVGSIGTSEREKTEREKENKEDRPPYQTEPGRDRAVITPYLATEQRTLAMGCMGGHAKVSQTSVCGTWLMTSSLGACWKVSKRKVLLCSHRRPVMMSP